MDLEQFRLKASALAIEIYKNKSSINKEPTEPC